MATVFYLGMLALSFLLAGSARRAARRQDWPQVVWFALFSLIVALTGFTNLIVSYLGGRCG